jgi:hypothetical protein
MAARSKASTVFGLSNIGSSGSNPARGMDVCLCFSVFVLSRVWVEALALGWSPAQGVLPKCLKGSISKKEKSDALKRHKENEKEEEEVSKSFRTVRVEREVEMVELSATRCSCIAILWVSLVSFAAITLCVASQRVFVVIVVYFVIDSVRKLLDTPSYVPFHLCFKWML